MITLVGCNHRTAPLAIRERLALTEREQQAVPHLQGQFH